MLRHATLFRISACLRHAARHRVSTLFRRATCDRVYTLLRLARCHSGLYGTSASLIALGPILALGTLVDHGPTYSFTARYQTSDLYWWSARWMTRFSHLCRLALSLQIYFAPRLDRFVSGSLVHLRHATPFRGYTMLRHASHSRISSFGRAGG